VAIPEVLEVNHAFSHERRWVSLPPSLASAQGQPAGVSAGGDASSPQSGAAFSALGHCACGLAAEWAILRTWREQLKL